MSGAGREAEHRHERRSAPVPDGRRLEQDGCGAHNDDVREEKLDLCGSLSAKDANIRQALVDRYAPGQPNFGKGTKKDPGFFYGFSAAIAVIGGADGPTAIFVTSRYNAQALWGLAVKVFSNVLVIVLNYVFSKLIIFKKK